MGAITFADVASLLGDLAILVIFLAGCWTVGRGLRSLLSGGRRLPRPSRARPPPRVTTPARAAQPVIIRPPQLLVAGRVYQVSEEEDKPPETCPWCLGSLEGEPPEAVVRCDRPYCGRAAHRRHNEEHGGCGGICSIVRA